MTQEGRRVYVSDYDDRGGYEDDVERKNSLRPGSAYPPPPPRDYLPSPRAGRSRASSNAPPSTFGQQSQPLRPVTEAVDNVVHQQEKRDEFNPDLVAQITEQVIQSLKLSGMVKQPQTDYEAPPLSSKSISSHPQGIPPPHTVTPPRSDRHEGSNVSSFSRPTNLQDFQDEWEGDDRGYKSFSSYDEDMESPKHTSTKLPDPPKAKPLQQEPEDDTTTLEKIWQPLFDASGRGTPRLGQFLRGLAMHIIADFEPQNSIVVTPQKMLKFYNDIRVVDELYPWQSIFDGTMSYSNLSYLYRDLQCEHFFVQEKSHGRPIIPALTPSGFEAWMTHIIRAHPDIEYKRFADAVLNMPISNADDPKERFPKELSRRLFPLQPNVAMQAELEDSILEEKKIKFPRRSANATSAAQASSSFSAQPTSVPLTETPRRAHASQPSFSSVNASPTPHFPPPPPPPQSQGRTLRHTSPIRTTSPIRHVQKPQPSQPHPPPHMYDSGNESSNSQSSHSPPVISLERERKPYIAQPGGGKVHERSNPNSAPPTPRSDAAQAAAVRPDPMPRQMSDVPEESPGGSRPGTSGKADMRRNDSNRDINSNNVNSNSNSNSNIRENRDSTASRTPTRTSSVARHSTAPPRQRRSSSLASAAANIKPGFASSRSDEFAPSSYSYDAYDREPRGVRSDRERDSEEEWNAAAGAGSRRYSRSSEEGGGGGQRVRRYVVPEMGNAGAGGGRYKMPSRQGSMHDDEYYRGRDPMV